MASPAQVLANRANAAASTGPKTDEGKSKVSQNALRSGLFSSRNCVAPEDAEAWETLRSGLWECFAPQTAAEELFTAEIVRSSWRLQRCASTEESLLSLTDTQEIASIQASVDRARTQASGVLNRAMEQLRKLQTERWVRNETLPKKFDSSNLGIAASGQVIAALASEMQRQLASAKVSGIRKWNSALAGVLADEANRDIQGSGPSAKQSQSPPSEPTHVEPDVRPQSAPRNAPCPCGSGRKSKRCCGNPAGSGLFRPESPDECAQQRPPEQARDQTNACTDHIVA